jgi:mRNA interferase MazF
MIKPERWNVYVVDLEPRIGSKPGKQRPCICIQPSEFCEAGLDSAVILPITSRFTKEDAFPLRVKIPAGICGLQKESEALINQILAWDVALFKKDLGPLPEAIQEQVSAALKDFLDL